MNIAIITGASSGLGMEYAKSVIEKYTEMDEIWLIARRKERLEQFAREHSQIAIRCIALDLCEDEAYDSFAEILEAEKPNIQILINNAGFEKTGRLDEMKKENILYMINLNVKALTMMNRICFPYMRKGAFAILTCSVASFCPVPSQTIYSSTKAYVRYMGRALREEMRKKGVNILTICPGNMNTEMNPKGGSSQSKNVDRLPFLDMEVLTRKSLDKASKGKAIYTPGVFYKGYRTISKIIPTAWMIKITGKSYSY